MKTTSIKIQHEPTFELDNDGASIISIHVACITAIFSKIIESNIGYNPSFIVVFLACGNMSPHDKGCWCSRGVAEQSDITTFLNRTFVC